MPKKAYFRAKMAVLILFPYCSGRKHNFWYPRIRKPLRHLIRIVLLVGMAPIGSKKPKFDPKWPKCQFWAKILIFTGGSKSFGTHITENHIGPLFTYFLVGYVIKWAKNANIWPKMPIFIPFILENGTFLFAQLYPVMALRSEFFMGSKISVFGPKILFLP